VFGDRRKRRTLGVNAGVGGALLGARKAVLFKLLGAVGLAVLGGEHRRVGDQRPAHAIGELVVVTALGGARTLGHRGKKSLPGGSMSSAIVGRISLKMSPSLTGLQLS
jgi:hypothetical protein